MECLCSMSNSISYRLRKAMAMHRETAINTHRPTFGRMSRLCSLLLIASLIFNVGASPIQADQSTIAQQTIADAPAMLQIAATTAGTPCTPTLAGSGRTIYLPLISSPFSAAKTQTSSANTTIPHIAANPASLAPPLDRTTATDLLIRCAFSTLVPIQFRQG